MEHLPLIKENINLTRQGRRDPRGPRKVNACIHGKKIADNFNELEKNYEINKEIGEHFIFKVIKDRTGRDSIDYTRIGLNLLAQLPNSIDIVEVTDKLVFASQLSEFTQNKIKVKRVAYESEFAPIDEFIFQTPEEKKGQKLKNFVPKPEEIFAIEIQLYTATAIAKENYKILSDFNLFLNKIKVPKIDDFVFGVLILIKVLVNREQLSRILSHKNVYYVDLPQQSIYDLKEVINYSFDDFPKLIKPERDAPLICIIDSGILTSHPLLEGSIYDSEKFGSLNGPFDEEGHGTMVAGIIQLGDVYKKLIEESPDLLKLPFRLLNARVTNEKNLFPDDKLIVKTIESAIKYFASRDDGDNCTIFNMSLGDPDSPFELGTKMDHWSFIVDQLIYKYNIAVVISSGNYYPDCNATTFADHYLEYLNGNKEANLIPPSLSMSAISVGSVVKDDTASKEHIAFAPRETISPFSRTGLGYANAIKPDVLAHGGNYSVNIVTKRLNESDKNLGILSTSVFNKGSWFEIRSGTSFAAPLITHYLGTIKQQIPNAKGNLLRALLLNTTTTNTPTQSLLTEKIVKDSMKKEERNTLIRCFQGMGMVRPNYAIKSYDNYVTMFYENQIEQNKANIFEVPVPEELYNTHYKSKIHITLAYNPPCRDSRIDYIGTKMTFDLFRGLSLEDVERYTCKPDNGEFTFESLPDALKKYKCKLQPSMETAAKGTAVHVSHELSRNASSLRDYGTTFYLVIKCQKRWYNGPRPQDFAIVVSIETENNKIDLYEKISQRIETRVRSRQQV